MIRLDSTRLICAVASVAFAATAICMIAPPAAADTLYVAAPNAIGPGRPLRLAADRRATQIGDLVAVQFDYSTSSISSMSNAQKKGATFGSTEGTGFFRLPFLQLPSGYTANSSSNSSKQMADTSSFSHIMMSTVQSVMPSGAMVIAGDEDVVIDGQKRTLHVTGTVRPEDIDNTDTVLSSRIADVQAKFEGNNKSDHHGLIQQVLDVLF